jgi:alcohol dehydrogenase class IV
MRTITIQQPANIVFGNHALDQFIEDIIVSGFKKLLVIVAPDVIPQLEKLVSRLMKLDMDIFIDKSIQKEPTVEMFTTVLRKAREFKVDSIAGIGGGSVLDVAKLVAALLNSQQTIQEIFGIKKLHGRNTYLVCLPTTAGTGSEVSPNAILLDTAGQLKKGVISPYLVPDAAYIDPLLTKSVPPAVTAATGLDAMIHCIEGYANKFAHPAVDIYALKGIEIIGQNLSTVVHDGENEDARAQMALGSMYGGLCLGPVNTAAVHALAYPLGSIYQIPHGVTNAVLLPHVLRFNVEHSPARYADIARALGVKDQGTNLEIALQGIEKIEGMMRDCGIPLRLSELKVSETAIDTLAESAMTVTRLLKNNVRPITLEDARQIFQKAF